MGKEVQMSNYAPTSKDSSSRKLVSPTPYIYKKQVVEGVYSDFHRISMNQPTRQVKQPIPFLLN